MPSLDIAAKVLRWREIDATKNAIQMAASSLYSHKTLQGKRGCDMLELIAAEGVEFDDYPTFFRRGTFIQRVVEERMLTDEELSRIPERHRPAGPVQRNAYVEVEPVDAYASLLST